MTRSPWLRVCGTRLETARFALAFAPAPGLPSLNLAAHRNSQAHSTKGTPPPSRAVTSCRSVVSGSISLPSPGFFSPFPHGTLLYRWPHVFSLGSWSTRIRTGFLVPRPTQAPRHGRPRTSPTGLSPSPAALSGAFGCPTLLPSPAGLPRAALQPRMCSGLGSSLFARRYWGNLS